MEDYKIRLEEKMENDLKISFLKLTEEERIAIIKKFLKDQKKSPTMKQTKDDFMFGMGCDKIFR